MLNLSGPFSGERRYNIHPTKTTLVTKISIRFNSGEDINRQWFIGEAIIGKTKKEKKNQKKKKKKKKKNKKKKKKQKLNIGIIRSEKEKNKLNMNKRISLARRTLYALIKTGVHGCNGINPF